MKFVIAPKWVLDLPDAYTLRGKHVKEIYGHAERGSIQNLLRSNSIPPPDIQADNSERKTYRWTVGYLKNFMKLPSELNQHYKEIASNE